MATLSDAQRKAIIAEGFDPATYTRSAVEAVQRV